MLDSLKLWPSRDHFFHNRNFQQVLNVVADLAFDDLWLKKRLSLLFFVAVDATKGALTGAI